MLVNPSYPLVSIVVITYNSENYVLETLESAKAQTYQNIELIITDDCSIDDTVSICKKWLLENKEHFVHSKLITIKENTGIPANCNRGVKASKGEWIKLIAGDDMLLSNCIELNLNFISKNRSSLLIHSRAQKYDYEFKEINKLPIEQHFKYRINKKGINSLDQLKILLRINNINAATTFISRDIFDKIGYFDEKYRLWEDRPMWLKLTKYGVTLKYLNEITVNYRITGNSASINRNRTLLFTETELQKEELMLEYGEYFGNFEYFLKVINLKRKKILKKMGFDKYNYFNWVLYRSTGFFINRYLSKSRKKYN